MSLGGGNERWIGSAQDFYGSESLLSDIVMVDTGHEASVKTHKTDNTRVNLKYHSGTICGL